MSVLITKPNILCDSDCDSVGHLVYRDGDWGGASLYHFWYTSGLWWKWILLWIPYAGKRWLVEGIEGEAAFLDLADEINLYVSARRIPRRGRGKERYLLRSPPQTPNFLNKTKQNKNKHNSAYKGMCSAQETLKSESVDLTCLEQVLAGVNWVPCSA